MNTLLTKFRPIICKSNVIFVKQPQSANFQNSPFLVDLGDINVKYEVSKSPEEWQFVERALPPTVVPTPVPKPNYLSEWKPQGENLQNRPYFIARTKNHMIPVYMEITRRGMKRITKIRRIQGDIWLLEKELVEFLQTLDFKPIRSQVNEFVGYIRIHGDFVNAVKYFLTQRNL